MMKIRRWMYRWLVGLMLVACFLTHRLCAQTMNTPSAATTNTAWLNRKLQAGATVRLPRGDLYINGRIDTAALVGCGRIITETGSGYSIVATPTYGQIGTRIIQTASNTPFLRIRGVGFVIDGPLEIIGDGTASCIQVEGRVAPATGHHKLDGLILRNWAIGFECLAGYYNTSGMFVSDENHADNTLVTRMETCNVPIVFRSKSLQALNWLFRDLMINNDGSDPATVVADIQRGGSVTFDRLIVEIGHVTLFRVQGGGGAANYSPNNARLIARDVWIDRMAGAHSFVVFEYAGQNGEKSYSDWFMDVDGFSGQYENPSGFYVNDSTLPKTHHNINIRSVYTE